MMFPWRRHTSFDVSHHSTRFESLRHRRRAVSGVFLNLTPQSCRSSNDAICVGITELPRCVASDTRSSESTYLISKDSRGSLAYSFTTPMKMVWALFQGLITGSNSWVALTFALWNGSGRLVKSCWKSFCFFRRIMGVTTFLNHRKTIILMSKKPLITIGQVALLGLVAPEGWFWPKISRFFFPLPRFSNNPTPSIRFGSHESVPYGTDVKVSAHFLHFPWTRIPY